MDEPKHTCAACDSGEQAKRHSYARQLRDAERSVVEAALRWREDGGVNALSIMRYSCTKLLALRAAAGKPDAG